MGKKYYGGIGIDKGFVMHSPESKYRYSPDDEFHKEGDKRDVGSTSNTGGGNSNDSTHNEGADESTGSVQGNFDAPYDDDRNNRDDELDDFFGDLLSIKACIALAIEGLFKAFMSRSMKRIDFVAVTLMLLVCMRVIGAVFIEVAGGTVARIGEDGCGIVARRNHHGIFVTGLGFLQRRFAREHDEYVVELVDVADAENQQNGPVEDVNERHMRKHLLEHGLLAPIEALSP